MHLNQVLPYFQYSNSINTNKKATEFILGGFVSYSIIYLDQQKRIESPLCHGVFSHAAKGASLRLRRFA
jgi:hypothetical protein